MAPRFVTSQQLPYLAFEPRDGVRLPLLNQPYMTDHLTYGGVALAMTGIDRLNAARLWHALFGLVLLCLLYDVARLLGLDERVALLSVLIAATSVQVTFMYALARFDESLASLGTLVVLWAALQYERDQRQRWVWVGVLAAAVAVSGKITALWPLSALAIVGALAGWRPPRARALAVPALVALPLLAPIVGFAALQSMTAHEIGRRLGFPTDLFTSDVIPGTAANLIAYLGSWEGILSAAMRGEAARAPNMVGQLLIVAALVWLVSRSVRSAPTPRWQRRETQMLVFVAVIFVYVCLFYREHRDYQFVILVPFYALGLAMFLERCAMALTRQLGWTTAGMVGCSLLYMLPIGVNLWDQHGLHEDLSRAHNAMFNLSAERASASWLRTHGIDRPIVATFYAVGTYEILTNGAVRPLYAFPLFRHENDRPDRSDLVAKWRTLFSEGNRNEYFVVLPVGQNPIEARHFDEPAIKTAMLKASPSTRVASFANRDGYPVLEIWQVTPQIGTESTDIRNIEPAGRYSAAHR